MKRQRGKFPWDLYWENKTYKLKRCIPNTCPLHKLLRHVATNNRSPAGKLLPRYKTSLSMKSVLLCVRYAVHTYKRKNRAQYSPLKEPQENKVHFGYVRCNSEEFNPDLTCITIQGIDWAKFLAWKSTKLQETCKILASLPTQV